jgi:hypothetical protein
MSTANSASRATSAHRAQIVAEARFYVKGGSLFARFGLMG